MQFSELTIRLLLIFFPGILASIILDNLTAHRARDFKVFLLNAFIMGLSSYFILFIIVSINNFIVKMRKLKPTWEVDFFKALIDVKATINITEVIIATLLAVLLSFVITAGINYKVLHRFAKYIKVTRKFGQLDVWSYVFESPDIDWILVRDPISDIMYQGWVEAFSETYDMNELFLRDVNVYRNSTAEFLYSMEGVYITRDQNNLLLEFPRAGNQTEGVENSL